MANKLKVYEIEDTDTGEIFKIEGPEDATEEELYGFLNSQLNSEPAAPVEASPTPAPQVPAPTAPAVVTPDPTPLGEQEIETSIQQGNSGGRAAVDPRFLGEDSGAFLADFAMRGVPYAEVNAIVRQKAQEAGQVAGVDVFAGGEAAWNKYAKEVREAGGKSSAATYSNNLGDVFNIPAAADVEAPEDPTWGEAFERSYQNAVQYGSSGILARTYHDWMGTGEDALREKFPDATDEQIEQLQENLIGQVQRGMRERGEKLAENDPIIPWLAAELVTAGVEDVVGPASAASTIARIATMGGVNAAADVGYQAADINAGVQDEFSGAQVAMSALFGAGLQAGVEGVGAIARRAMGSGDSPDVNPNPNSGTIRSLEGRKNTKQYKARLEEVTSDIGERVKQTISKWNVAEDSFVVHKNFKDIKGIDDDAIGVYRGDGKVAINAEAVMAAAARLKVDPENIVDMITFHEGLGHFGLDRQFGDELDRVLNDFYDNGNSKFREEVDAWLTKNPTAYAKEPDRLARAAEEVLAKWSEKGQLPVTLVDTLTNLIKKFIRTMGFDLSYSNREIKSFLALSHSRVGEASMGTRILRKAGPKAQGEVGADSLRYMYVGRKFEGKLDKDNLKEAQLAAARGYDVGPGSDIRKQTGWFKAKDGMWRNEVDDSLATSFTSRHDDLLHAIAEHRDIPTSDLYYATDGFSSLEVMARKQDNPDLLMDTLPLKQVLDHPDLMAGYEDLFEDVLVTRSWELTEKLEADGLSYNGYWDPAKREIYINPNLSERKAMSTLLHEVQHVIQGHEGFETGGNTGSIMSLIPFSVVEKGAKQYKKYLRAALAKARFDEHLVKGMGMHPDVKVYRAAMQEATFYYDMSDQARADEQFRSAQELEDDGHKAYLKARKAYDRLRDEATPEELETIWELVLKDPYNDKQIEDLIESAESNTKYHKENLKEFEEVLDSGDKALLRDILRKDKAVTFSAYEHILGEVEARDVQLRWERGVNRQETEPYTLEENIDPDSVFAKSQNYVLADETSASEESSNIYDLEEARHKKFDRENPSFFGPREFRKRLSLEEIEALIEEDLPRQNQADREALSKELKARREAEETLRGAPTSYNDNAKYMRPTDLEDIQPQKGEVTLNDLFEMGTAKSIIDHVNKDYTPTPKDWATAKAEARAMGLNSGHIRKGKGIQDLDARMFKYDQVAQGMSERLAVLGADVQRGDFSKKGEYLETLFKFNEVVGRIFDDQAQIARALNALKAIETTRRRYGELSRILEDYGADNALAAFADDKVFARFAHEMQSMVEAGNHIGAGVMARQVMKPYWWQYILSFRHAMMLSGLGTHAKNAMDNATMISRNLEETLLAAPFDFIRKGLRVAGKDVDDGVSVQEAVGHTYGIFRALFDSATYLDAARAFKEGHGSTPYSAKIEMQDAYIPGIGKVNSALFAADTFFRAFHKSANLYSLGVRQARAEGFKGMALFEEGAVRAADPDEKMLAMAQKKADEALLVDTPSGWAAKAEAFKAVRPNMSGGEQAMAFTANMLLPFFRVTDRLLFQAIRRSPLSFLDKNTRAAFKAGGAERDIAIARTVYGTALMAYYWQQAGDQEGGVVGETSKDYKKIQALEAGGFKQNAIREDGQYVDATALNLNFFPWDTQNNVAANVASIREAWEKGKATEDETMAAFGASTKALLNVLASQSYAENLSTYLELVNTRSEGEQDVNLAGFVGGTAAQFVPAMARQVNQQVLDPVKRDTRGDKSFGDRVYGRVVSGIPGLSTTLPTKYDLYGDPIPQGRSTFAMNNYATIKDDPVSVELQKLERTVEAPVVTGFKGYFQYEGEDVKLNAEGIQEWNRRQGYYLRDLMLQEISTPEWSAMSNEDKIALVKDVRKEAYEYTKEDMLPLLGLTEEEESDEE